MNLTRSQQLIRLAIIGGAVVFVGLIIWATIVAVGRAGKIGVDVTIYPDDAALYVDNRYVSTLGGVYVTPGQHTFTAKKSGFDDAVSTTTIDADHHTVVLLPAPSSDAALQWANQSSVSAKRESLGGLAADTRGATISDQNPIIDQLPYTDIAGPFAIDYGFTGTDNSKIYLLIHDSTPHGRVAALAWIRSQGIDPTTLDIHYDEYKNPLTTGDK